MPPAAGLHGLTHLLAGDTEWRNIQTIIKTTLQAVASIVSSHAAMLDTIDARIDRIQDAALTAQSLAPPRVSNNDDDASMVVSRKDFLALVADVRKMQKRAVSSDDVEARVVACGNEIKRRLDHTIAPLQDAMRDMEDMVTKEVLARATTTFATKDALRQLKDEVANERHAAKPPTHHIVTRSDLQAVEERVMAEAKTMHRAQAAQVKESVGHLEKGFRKHLADHLAVSRDELKKLKAQVDESLAATSSDCHAQLRQRAMASDVKVVLADKVDRADLDARERKLEDRVGGRLDDALQQAVAEWKHEVAAALHKKCHKSDVAKLLARKVNREDVDVALADKVSHAELHESLKVAIAAVHDEAKQDLRQVQHVLEAKLHDHGDMVTQHVRDLQHEHAQHADGWTGALEDLRSKVAVKMGIKDACTLFDTKCNVADVNDALGALQDTIHAKADEGDLQALVEDLTGLRKQMRGELCVGRWIWKTGRPTDRHTIAWTVQVVNTNPDVFAWDKGSDHVTAILPGLYQLQASFFTDYAPTLQVLVNGEPALVLQGDKGDALGPRRRRRHAAGNVTGITLCEFLALPPRATVSITYDIDERAQGFLTLRKL